MTPEQQALSEKLTKLQRAVVLGVVAGKSQRQAYYDAGGNANSEAAADTVVSRMFRDVEVSDFYESLIAEAAKGAVLTRERALERLTLMAETEITDILEFRTIEVQKVGKDGEIETDKETTWLMKDSPEIERRARAAIKSVTMTKQGPKIEMYDSSAAIAQIAKMQGWDAPTKVANTDSQGNDVPVQNVDSALVRALIDKLVD